MFKQVFKSITVDNGSEFAYCEELERSILERGNGRSYITVTRIAAGSEAQMRLLIKWYGAKYQRGQILTA